MKRTVRIWAILLAGILVIRCGWNVTDNNTFQLKLPAGFPEPVIPEDNKLTEARIALGKKLFYDPILSLDTSLSCASCHFQRYAFSDTAKISTGVHGKTGMRNAPPLINLAYNTSFFRDGGVPTLEMQVISPIQTEEEMHLNMVVAVQRIKNHPEYPALIREAYNRDPDAFSITRSIAAFERILISGNSRYDQFKYGKDENTLNSQEIEGMELFFGSRLKCAECHSGFNFTSQKTENNGLYDNYENDPGKMRITLKTEDEGLFKVPTLRNIELTGPYMHDGSMNTLEEVIDHYASGGSSHPNKNKLITGFTINSKEKQALIAFLNSLTDDSFIKNEAFYP